NITGYRLYRYNQSNGTYSLAVTTKNNYFNVSGRSPATAYTYMVRAYKKVSGKNYLSDTGVLKKVTLKPEKVTVIGGAFNGKKFNAKWKKVASSGYQLGYSKDKKVKKGVKIIDIKNGSATSKKFKLSRKKKYYFRVRAYVKANGKTLYGKWSAKKTTSFNNVYSSFITYFSSPFGRTTNIKRACKYIDGKILNPGDTFSFNRTVGQRTAARGFKMATVYSGTTVAEGIGGGVCQVSTTIFNAALLANLPIYERHQHTMKVHYVTPGRDAAISWGSCDMKFNNNTSDSIKISAKVYNNSKIVVKLLTNADKKHKKVRLSVSRSGSTYKLTRKASGKVNYTTYSTY
ncbi:MAG: VanW family protein, partial [Clostridia bacterium]|nr:VanW family protein [Clostridia bacterium]